MTTNINQTKTRQDQTTTSEKIIKQNDKICNSFNLFNKNNV